METIRYHNRIDAGHLLAKALRKFKHTSAVVVGLARGGVVVAEQVAHELGCALNVLVVKKISFPDYPEVAIGAVTADGAPVLEPSLRSSVGIGWLAQQISSKRRQAIEQEELYHRYCSPLDLAGRVAIIVDDGIATGYTAQAAIRQLIWSHPSQIILAVPVIPVDTAVELRQEHCQLVALIKAKDFLGGVGSYYEDFPQVSNNVVVEILKSSASPQHIQPVVKGGENYVYRTTRSQLARSRT